MSTPSDKRFAVALSFAGEHRPFIAKIAELLAEKLGRGKVLYDGFLTAELARPNLDLYLTDLYRVQSELLVPFFSADYDCKEWYGLEWRQMRDILKKKGDDEIMPFLFDDSPIAGVLSIDGYVKVAERTPDDVASLILQRLEAKRGQYFEDEGVNQSVPGMNPDANEMGAFALLMLLAQTYYKLLECATGTPVGMVDLELNHYYLWTVSNLTNLLNNHEALTDFPERFDPLLPDLFPPPCEIMTGRRWFPLTRKVF